MEGGIKIVAGGDKDAPYAKKGLEKLHQRIELRLMISVMSFGHAWNLISV